MNHPKNNAKNAETNPAPADQPNSASAAYNEHLDDLHDLFAVAPSANGPDDEDPLAQLRDDPNYAALIRDLEYIASQARLLFAPAEEAPSDEVWNKIQNQLSHEAKKSDA